MYTEAAQGCSDCQTQDQKGHHDRPGRRLRVMVLDQFGCEHHGNGTNVAIGHGKQNNQNQVDGITVEDNLERK